jgi:hypothetical protein
MISSCRIEIECAKRSEEYTNAGSASTLIPTLGASAISFGGAELSGAAAIQRSQVQADRYAPLSG